jgi:hypothetical protein
MDKGQGTRDKGQGTRDKGQGMLDSKGKNLPVAIRYHYKRLRIFKPISLITLLNCLFL